MARADQSHLLQMRGLKQLVMKSFKDGKMSHLLQMRGLKHPKVQEGYEGMGRIFYRCVDWNNRIYCIIVQNQPVASFTDAWIETFWIVILSKYPIVASFTDAWIETHHLLCNLPLKVVASFTDAWIETFDLESVEHHDTSHLLQMRGLKRL